MFKITEIDDGAKLRFEMRNESGELESSFVVNPYDFNFCRKLDEIGNFVKASMERKINSKADWVTVDESLAFLVSEALGGGQEGSIFRKYAPTELMPDGQTFATAVVSAVVKASVQRFSHRRERWMKRSYNYRME